LTNIVRRRVPVAIDLARKPASCSPQCSRFELVATEFFGCVTRYCVSASNLASAQRLGLVASLVCRAGCRLRRISHAKCPGKTGSEAVRSSLVV
jgi:hypothetical protein